MRNGTHVIRLILKKGALLAAIFLMATSMIACSKKNKSDEKAGAGIKTEGNVGKKESRGKSGKAPDSQAEAGKSAVGGDNSQVSLWIP